MDPLYTCTWLWDSEKKYIYIHRRGIWKRIMMIREGAKKSIYTLSVYKWLSSRRRFGCDSQIQSTTVQLLLVNHMLRTESLLSGQSLILMLLSSSISRSRYPNHCTLHAYRQPNDTSCFPGVYRPVFISVPSLIRQPGPSAIFFLQTVEFLMLVLLSEVAGQKLTWT